MTRTAASRTPKRGLNSHTRRPIIKHSLDDTQVILVSTEGVEPAEASVSIVARSVNRGTGRASLTYLYPNLQEVHLQEVLSVASMEHRNTISGDGGHMQVAHIPIPDNSGIVQEYEALYPSGAWKDPYTYLMSSDTVEDATSFALAHGSVYFMDEHDKVWLDHYNEQVRCDDKSDEEAVLAMISEPGNSTQRTQKPSAVHHTVIISEDTFELVMAILEKPTSSAVGVRDMITGAPDSLQDLERSAWFPPFADYEDVFTSPLTQKQFAAYSVPKWVPPPSVFVDVARAIYPHWRARRLQLGGRQIIPSINVRFAATSCRSALTRHTDL